MSNRDVGDILGYHEATKHSVESVYRKSHHLDWEIMPRPFKVYTDLEPIPLQTDKITTIIKASANAGIRVVINARTDVFLKAIGAPEARLGVAIERGKAFLAAGADCVFVPGVRDRETIGELVRGIGGPVNILATAGAPSIPDLQALGVARVSLGSGPMRATLALVRKVAHELKGTGTYGAFTDDAMSFNEVNELMK